MDATAAQGPWSNGVSERDNSAIKRTFLTLRLEAPSAPAQHLIYLPGLAKNSPLVHSAASPHQLMCGSSPRLPSAVSESPPARSDLCWPRDAILEQTLSLIRACRSAFLQVEADQSLRRALNCKTRSPGVTRWTPNTTVVYWGQGVSPGTSGWRGPAKVGGLRGRKVLLCHGGQWLTRDTGAVKETNLSRHNSPSPARTPHPPSTLVQTILPAMRGSAGEPLLSPIEPAPASDKEELDTKGGPDLVLASATDIVSVSPAPSGDDAGVAMWRRFSAALERLSHGGLSASPNTQAPPPYHAEPPVSSALHWRFSGRRAPIARFGELPPRFVPPAPKTAEEAAAEEALVAEYDAICASMGITPGSPTTLPTLTTSSQALSDLPTRNASTTDVPSDANLRKTRFVIRRFEDSHRRYVVNSSPTVGSATRRALMAMMATKCFVPQSVDQHTAFLQGMPMSWVAPVFVVPPPQARVPTGVIWRLRKCAHGILDATQWWYQTISALIYGIRCTPARRTRGYSWTSYTTLFSLGSRYTFKTVSTGASTLRSPVSRRLSRNPFPSAKCPPPP